MLHTETVLESTLDLLRRLQSLQDLAGLRLVGGTALAAIQDIAAMKLSAAANRGRKKDFIDIAFLIDIIPLSEMFQLYQRKFSVSEFSFALRGLTYFDDAEDDPMPEMLIPITWEAVKHKIESTVRGFVRDLR